MDVEIREVRDKRQQLEFIRFPYQLYNNHPNWLPPLLADEKKFFNPLKNTGFSVSDTIRFLAYRNGRITGRIMGIIHHPFNEENHEKTGRFFAFDCYDDAESATALIRSVEDWCRKRGMDQVVGPFGFSDKDPQGILISGYEHRGILIAPYNFPYYHELISANGYTKMVDLVEYLIPVPSEIPEFYRRISPRILKNPSIHCVEFKNKKQLKPYIIPVLQLMCETFGEIYGSSVLTEEEMKKLAREYLPVLDPDFIKVIEFDGEPVAFILGMPDIGPGLQRAKGHLFPFGIFHILREMKRTRYLVLFLGGIRKQFQGKGLDVLMGTKILESLMQRGYKEINSHLELETNVKVRAEMERTGGKIYKSYRIFKKRISDF
jgi:hypothetical protein